MDDSSRIPRPSKGRTNRTGYAFEPDPRPIDSANISENRWPASGSNSGQGHSSRRGRRLSSTDWCTCGTCRPVNTEMECVCCKERVELEGKWAIIIA